MPKLFYRWHIFGVKWSQNRIAYGCWETQLVCGVIDWTHLSCTTIYQYIITCLLSSRQDKKRPPLVDPSLCHELEPDTCALASSLRKDYCPLPVSHQRYDDSPGATDVYSWRGRNFTTESAPGDGTTMPVHCNTGTLVTTTRSGSRGNVLENQQPGTYPRTMVKQPCGKGHDNLHVYETPK